MNTERIKKELQKRKEELTSRLERTHNHIYHKEEPVSSNFNEQIKETENDNLVMALEADGIEELNLINKALQRIEDGDYTECSQCGSSIGEQRLDAIPYADRCINCAS